MQEKLEQLNTRLGQIHDLRKAAAVLAWDQRTYMPPGGAAARSEQLSTLASMAHQLFVADETGTLLEALQPLQDELDYDSDDASLIRVTTRYYKKLRSVPPALVAERARVSTLAQEAWARARDASDFDLFAPLLKKNIDLNIQLAEALGYEDHLYDALLDQYEPEVKTADLHRLFEPLKTESVPLIEAMAAQNGHIDDAFLDQEFDAEAQLAFGRMVLKDIGFDFKRGRQDMSLHPFTISFAPDDVRLTTRVNRHKLQSALFGSVHEAGHGMYEQGIRSDLARTSLGSSASLGVHESQSRLWENIIGRSHGFWRYYFPRLQCTFPDQFGHVNLETFYRAINQVQPSYIRVEADEVTYNMHIFLRFELEVELLEGRMSVADLPQAWKDRMEAYLGIVPPDDARGVLQDIHWADGMMGYFPTYTLGNLLSVQFFNQAVKAQPTIPSQIEAGQFDTLHTWLVQNIHFHGNKYTPAELTRRVTGDQMRAEPFVAYVKEKYAEIYDL